MRTLRLVTGLLLLVMVSACSSPEKPTYSGLKIGKPYYVMGQHYSPAYDSHYDEIGMASWYGPGFHGGKTALGEHYDQNAMTAAHRTLPLPSIVRVTNLNNGKSVVLRINDRGPFKRGRIIDLSKAAAEQLDMVRVGSAKVRVQFLDKETHEYVMNMQRGNMYAMNAFKQSDPNMPGALDAKKPDIPYEMVPAPPPSRIEVNTAQANPIPAPVTQAPAPSLQVVQADSNASDEFAVVEDASSPAPAPRYLAPPRAMQASAGMSGFFVQVGTFGLRDNANKLLDKLSSYGSSTVTEVMANQRKFYRVMMGPFNMQADAKNMLSKLAAIGIPDARIIRN